MDLQILTIWLWTIVQASSKVNVVIVARGRALLTRYVWAVDTVSNSNMKPDALERRCHYHPDRAGVGLCMACRVIICVECSTRLDGINHCASCLSELTKSSGDVAGRGHALRQWVSLTLCMAIVVLGVYAALRVLYVWGQS